LVYQYWHNIGMPILAQYRKTVVLTYIGAILVTILTQYCFQCWPNIAPMLLATRVRQRFNLSWLNSCVFVRRPICIISHTLRYVASWNMYYFKDNYRFTSATWNQLSKELREKLLGSDREGLGLGIGLGIIDRRSKPDRRSEAINFGAC